MLAFQLIAKIILLNFLQGAESNIELCIFKNISIRDESKWFKVMLHRTIRNDDF